MRKENVLKMRKLFSTLLVLTLLLGAMPVLAGSAPSEPGPPALDINTVIVPDSLSVYPGDTLGLTATTTVTAENGEARPLQFISDQWLGVDFMVPAVEAELEPGETPDGSPARAFVSTAGLVLDLEPGEYDLVVRYEITLSQDASGQRVYYLSSESALITVTVMEGSPDEEEPDEPAEPGAALNHGQIVSAWAHWKQTKGNKNFLPGGPGVYRSLVWYKTQVEYREFHSRQEVFDYLDSIYEPAPRERKQPNPNKGPGNNNKGK